ncbi:tRNA (adenosine(37)-N6)-threonylcarbamoyltransferase complex dimerization subunit type 1 TsaB [Conchiformibius steedae]|uniref:tRNA (Adenosine(37)-N6)-threonylcarbamoyltransferase complex dimerization subunit type 1 TsaB n=1 Tax=Conchiformibius steedae TaxID=153493 RepID=A0A3P2A2F9_9NEIS|nr:tRNA (adenosine(37)-N6)-threonylcarbamoyltransferase complex dimerization subunit type 1 TsaB [Conchiformibius steedae]RRD89612.1 tRNA (adenosine(37)-N6)-threonylcarbamoyltransferase complex dimerization subunit type 1 TsaB [Conchiformibius steedae]
MNFPDLNRPVLAIDTGTSVLSLALRVNGTTRTRHAEAGTRHAELILPRIRELFDEFGIDAADLGAVVYAQGPGAFTGLRIGIGTAQGLATPFDTPLIGVPSLDAAAYLLPPSACVLAAIDARMDEVFYAWFDTVNHVRLSDYQVGEAAVIAAPDDAVWDDIRAVGNAFELDYPPPFEGLAAMPTAVDFLELADSGRYPATDAASASLLYVRDKVALTAAEQIARRAGQA